MIKMIREFTNSELAPGVIDDLIICFCLTKKKKRLKIYHVSITWIKNR